MPQSRTVRGLGLAVAATGLVAAAAPAFAQAYYTVPEVVVTPERLGPDGRPETLSRTVSIADLDLRYDRDVREMQRRVRTTARQICEDLGERDVIPSVERNCVNDAVRRTDYQMRTAIAEARSGTYYAYAAPPAVAPYAGYYAPPASAVVPVYPTYPAEPPPDL
jgi:UrcA family protein